MKKFTLLTIVTFLCTATISLFAEETLPPQIKEQIANATDIISEIPYKAPPFPISTTGKYEELISQSQIFLREGKMLDFYIEMGKLYELLEANMKKLEYNLTREEVMAIAWYAYIGVAAPLVDDETFLLRKGKTKGKFFNDVYVKNRAEEFLLRRLFFENKLLKNTLIECYTMGGQKIPEDKILKEQVRAFHVNNLLYFIAYEKSFRVISAQKFKEKEALEYKPTPGWKPSEGPEPAIRITKEMSKEEQEEQWRIYRKALRDRKDPAQVKYDFLFIRKENVFMSTLPANTQSKNLVDNIAWTFPRDGATVRKYIRLSGYTKDEEIDELISKTFVRSKESEYLFTGTMKPVMK